LLKNDEKENLEAPIFTESRQMFCFWRNWR